MSATRDLIVDAITKQYLPEGALLESIDEDHYSDDCELCGVHEGYEVTIFYTLNGKRDCFIYEGKLYDLIKSLD